MKQLSINEMNTISGGYTWDFSSTSGIVSTVVGNSIEAVASAAVAGALGGMVGSIIGGAHGGNGGGLLGFGAAAQGVGMIWGLVVGAIACGAAGITVGWDMTFDKGMKVVNGLFNGTFAPWK